METVSPVWMRQLSCRAHVLDPIVLLWEVLWELCMTLTKIWIADQDVATREVHMVAFIEHQHVFGVLHCVQLSCTDIVFMMLSFPGTLSLIHLISVNRLPVSWDTCHRRLRAMSFLFSCHIHHLSRNFLEYILMMPNNQVFPWELFGYKFSTLYLPGLCFSYFRLL